MIRSPPDIHARTRLLIGDAGLARLGAARVAVIGLGGVGSAAAEEFCRAGVGRLTLVDFDEVRESNLNRQLSAPCSTLGRPKAAAAADARLPRLSCPSTLRPLILLSAKNALSP